MWGGFSSVIAGDWKKIAENSNFFSEYLFLSWEVRCAGKMKTQIQILTQFLSALDNYLCFIIFCSPLAGANGSSAIARDGWFFRLQVQDSAAGHYFLLVSFHRFAFGETSPDHSIDNVLHTTVMFQYANRWFHRRFFIPCFCHWFLRSSANAQVPPLRRKVPEAGLRSKKKGPKNALIVAIKMGKTPQWEKIYS